MKLLVSVLITIFAVNIYSAKYANVDLQLVVKTVKAGIRVRTKLEKEFKKKQKEIKAMETNIQKRTKDFQQKAKYLSPEKQQAEQQKIQELMMKYRELVGKSQNTMQQKQMELTKPIIDSTRKVITEIAKNKKYDLVYEKNQSGIFYAKDADDITNSVIKKYNEIHK